MPQPVTVSIPHRLGKEEALRRVRSGLDRAQSGFGGLSFGAPQWNGDAVNFSAGAFGQHANGVIAVAEDHIRIEIELPWLLAQMAEKAKALMQEGGQRLLEKK
ncbi:MAG: polyhydroxyalkanoic acid system family protein [Variibacter sp.]|nr:polyhydroxyalkanoic acid system family protein [Variibacter sp.]